MNTANATRAANLADAFHHADLAAPAIEGKQIDSAFLDHLHAARVQPDELAAFVACVHFLLLNALCQVVGKVLAMRHD
jgi:hypothetical protein